MRRFIFLLLVVLASALSAAAQEATSEPHQPGEVRQDAFDIEQVYVSAGCFKMGTSDAEADYARSLDAPAWAVRRLPSEQPQHEVCLSKGYWIDRYEVTNTAFQAFVDAGGYMTLEYWSQAGRNWLNRSNKSNLPLTCADSAADDQPRVCVTWFEAEAYAHWRGGALPTEAQWEYAARGQESRIYPWGNEWNRDYANVVNSEGLAAVGGYPDGVSWVGADDMAGNAMEWVQDWLSQRYDGESVTDPTGPARGSLKVEKGGWWGSNPVVARAAYRHFEDPPEYFDHHIGFRIVSPDTE